MSIKDNPSAIATLKKLPTENRKPFHTEQLIELLLYKKV